jgi:hypothetical protein
MKVRNSQIPENSGKPIIVNHISKWLDEVDDENKKRQQKTVLNLTDFNKVIQLTLLKTISKDTRFVENPKARWQHGIIINKDLNANSKQNIEAWYNTVEQRDERWEQLIKTLEEIGYNVICI